MREGFDNAMMLNRKLFGEHAFRKSLAANDAGAYRSVINISLFEVCAVTMSELPSVLDPATEGRLKNAIVGLVNDDEFARAITYSTNSTAAVQRRFDAMEEATLGVIQP